MDADFEGAPPHVQRGYLAMLAIDALLAFQASLEKLGEAAVEGGGALPPGLSRGAGSGAPCGGLLACHCLLCKSGQPALLAPE